MNPDDGARLFRQCKRLFEACQYSEALQQLSQLDAAFPGTQNVQLLRSYCLEALGREDEALAVCRSLAVSFRDVRAWEMIQRITCPIGGAFEEQFPESLAS